MSDCRPVLLGKAETAYGGGCTPSHQELEHRSVVNRWDRPMNLSQIEGESPIEGELQKDCTVSVQKCTLYDQCVNYAINMHIFNICIYSCSAFIAYVALKCTLVHFGHSCYFFDEQSPDPQIPTRDQVHIFHIYI